MKLDANPLKPRARERREVTALLKDSYGRRIRDLRVSLTDRCNFRCFYCLPHGEPPAAPKSEMLTYEEIEFVSDGIEGLLVLPRDPEALAAGLVRVLTEPDLASRLGEAGRERARSFDWAIVVDRLEELYLRAVESAGYDRRR